MRTLRTLLLLAPLALHAGAAPQQVQSQQAPLPADASCGMLPELQQNAWSQVRDAWDELHGYLEELDPQQRTDWRNQLQLDRIEQLLQRDGSPDADRLRSLASVFYQAKQGLESPAFLRFRQALLDYCEVASTSSRLNGEFDMKALGELIDELLESPQDQHETDQIGRCVAMLAATGLDPERVRALREQYHYPNLYIEASQEFIREQLSNFDGEIDQWDQISTTILGARVSGPAHTRGNMAVKIPPSEDLASFNIHVQGTIHSPSNVAVRQPAVIYSSGLTDFHATAEVYWDGQQFSTRPIRVQANTRTAIHDVTATTRRRSVPVLAAFRRRLISRIGTRQAQTKRREGELEASRQARERIASQVDQQVAEAISSANQQVTQSFRIPLTRLGMFPEIGTTATEKTLVVNARQLGPGGLAAPQAPTWKPAEGVISLCLHQSAISNFLYRQNGGAFWTDKDFAEMQKQLVGETSYEFRIGAHRRWAVVFDSDRPFSAAITPEGIIFRTRIRELLIEDERFPYPFEIAVTYALDCDTSDVRWTRVGDVRHRWTAEPPAERTQKDDLEAFLLTKFAGFYLDEAYLDGLNPPAGGQWSQLSKLYTAQVDLQPGWLRILFRQ